jgi:hypothetical protein
MKNLRLLAISAMVVVALILGIQSTSHALMKLYLYDGVNPPVIITDEGLGDLTGGEGAITYSGAIGNWSVNVTTGISYPVLGSPGVPYLDLNSINTTSVLGGNLVIGAAQTGFTMFDSISGVAGPFTLAAGGTTAGSVDFDVWLNTSNLYPWGDLNNIVFLDLFFGSSPFSGSITETANGVFDPYSLTIRADIRHAGAGSTSFDAELQGGKVPEPISLILLGSGLAGAGLYRRLRKPRG